MLWVDCCAADRSVGARDTVSVTHSGDDSAAPQLSC